MHYRKTLSRRGLTLIDVIAIIMLIAIGILMLLPYLGTPDRGGRKAVCKSNLKNIGLCAKMYSQDYNDKWPTFHSGDSPENARDADELSILWDTFITDAALLYCPSADEDVRTGMDTSLGCPIVLNVSYCYIANGSTSDERMSAVWAAGCGWSFDRRGRPSDPIHDGGTNMLFGDGHVEWKSGWGGRNGGGADGARPAIDRSQVPRQGLLGQGFQEGDSPGS